MPDRLNDLRRHVESAEAMKWEVSWAQHSALFRLHHSEAALDRAQDHLFQTRFQQRGVSGRSRYADVWELRARADFLEAQERLAEAKANHVACLAEVRELDIRFHAAERDLAYARGRLADYHRERRHERNGESADPYRSYRPQPNEPLPKPTNYPPRPRPQQKPTVDMRTQPSRVEIAGWFQSVDAVFADVSTMHKFPLPPFWNCGRPACETTRGSRVLEACSCNIKHLFIGRGDLKKERLRWHPDKFARTAPDRKDGFQKMAREVFVVVDGLYRGEQKK